MFFMGRESQVCEVLVWKKVTSYLAVEGEDGPEESST
jgi:hypothetical protein